jgi:thioredoxin 1
MPGVPDMPPLAFAGQSGGGGNSSTIIAPMKTVQGLAQVVMMMMQGFGQGPGGPGGPGMPPPGVEIEMDEGPATRADSAVMPDPALDNATFSATVTAPPLSEAKVVELTDDSFKTTVGGARPTLVVFWAKWSTPSKRQVAIAEQISREHGARLTVASVDIDAARAAAGGINAVPTMVLYRNGSRVAALEGAAPKTQVDRFVASRIR